MGTGAPRANVPFHVFLCFYIIKTYKRYANVSLQHETLDELSSTLNVLTCYTRLWHQGRRKKSLWLGGGSPSTEFPLKGLQRMWSTHNRQLVAPPGSACAHLCCREQLWPEPCHPRPLQPVPERRGIEGVRLPGALIGAAAPELPACLARWRRIVSLASLLSLLLLNPASSHLLPWVLIPDQHLAP